MRAPTVKQYRLLTMLGDPRTLVVSGSSDPTRRLLAHGWVAPKEPGADNGFRITPDGLRALAAAVEKHGYPCDLGAA